MHIRYALHASATAALAAIALLASAPLSAQQNPSAAKAAEKDQQVKRAQERCSMNHGVNCDTPEGLQEWLLQDRSREEAVSEGSRHIVPGQGGPSGSRR